ncbi:MAG TPA: MBL fold metallo-hydrolase [Acidobacteriaceae bacterium]|nr:MBL fold metallo-hydrolase [Acidobacteriaceae bacterium]
MDKVEIDEDQTVPMDPIASGLSGLKIAFVNVFGVQQQDGSWTLIDTAIPLSAGRIKTWAEKTFRRPPNAIVLTHGHFDHAGAAKQLAEEWNVSVYAHPLEFPYLTGEREYAAPDWKAGGGVMPLMSPIFPRGPIDLGSRLKPLPEEGSDLASANLPGWRLIHSPGHTPGHVSFFRESDRTLLVGDAFCTTRPESFFAATVTQTPELHGPPAYFTSDWSAATQSVRKLAEMEPATVAPGHGKPLAGADVPQALHTLADNFERIAIPADVKAGTQAGETTR